MPRELSVGVIGDFNPHSETHTATNLAFRHAATRLSVSVDIEWVTTFDLEKKCRGKIGTIRCIPLFPGKPL